MQVLADLHGRGYRLGPRLGKGSYAKVKLAQRLADDQIVAVKIINKRRAAKEFVDKFLPRELSIQLTINHRNIIQLYEVIHQAEAVCVVMEYAGRGDLLDFVKRRGWLTEDQAGPVFYQVCQGLSYLHGINICHRDLKCENILLRQDLTVAISDFGFARTLGDEHTLSQTYCGSAAYASPELLRGRPYLPRGNDVWSLGCVLFIMVTGQMPFYDKNTMNMLYRQLKGKVSYPDRRGVAVSAPCREVIGHALQPNTDRRWTVDAITGHPWVTSYKGSNSPSSVSEVKETAATTVTSSSAQGTPPTSTITKASTPPVKTKSATPTTPKVTKPSVKSKALETTSSKPATLETGRRSVTPHPNQITAPICHAESIRRADADIEVGCNTAGTITAGYSTAEYNITGYSTVGFTSESNSECSVGPEECRVVGCSSHYINPETKPASGSSGSLLSLASANPHHDNHPVSLCRMPGMECILLTPKRVLSPIAGSGSEICQTTTDRQRLPNASSSVHELSSNISADTSSDLQKVSTRRGGLDVNFMKGIQTIMKTPLSISDRLQNSVKNKQSNSEHIICSPKHPCHKGLTGRYKADIRDIASSSTSGALKMWDDPPSNHFSENTAPGMSASLGSEHIIYQREASCIFAGSSATHRNSNKPTAFRTITPNAHSEFRNVPVIPEISSGRVYTRHEGLVTQMRRIFESKDASTSSYPDC